MDFRPEVDWQLARRLAGRLRGALPEATRTEAVRIIADIRLRARDAGPIAAEAMRRSARDAAGTILVVDRDGWAQGASEIAEAALESLRWPRRADGLRRTLSRLGLGAVLGLGLGVGSRWMLGQYDAFTGRRRMMLVAPNIVASERRNQFVARDFRRWVAIHEHTHALQFAAAPWLVGHLGELITGAQTRAAIDRVVAVMTFLEGHADFVSDTTGRVPTSSHLRKAFGRRPRKGAGLLDKQAQYANGLEFCRGVASFGPDAADSLMRVFEGPEHLPNRQEITDPRAWYERVCG